MKIRAMAAVFAAVALASLVAYAQAPAAQDLKEAVQDRVRENAQRTRGTATGPDANIKAARPSNRMDAPRPAPENKGGKPPAARGTGYCTVVFDNYTGWFIDTYVDGEFAGTVTPWGDLSAYAVSGGTRLYGRAAFDDGSYIPWGPRTYTCPSNGTFTWSLYP